MTISVRSYASLSLTDSEICCSVVQLSHLLSSNGDHIAQLSSLSVNLYSIVQELFKRSRIKDAVLYGDVAVDHELDVLLFGCLLRLWLQIMPV